MTAHKKLQPAAYRLLAADELGVLRVIEVPAGPKWSEAALVQKWGEADKEQAITCVSCSSSDLSLGTPALVAVGRRGRRVDVIDALTGQQQASMSAPAPADATNRSTTDSQVQLAAAQFVPAAKDRPLQLITATSDGVVSVCSFTSSSSSWFVSRSFQAGSSIMCLDVDDAGSHVVVGGEGVQPSIWDLATGNRIWQGKGSKPNRQTLLVDKPFTTSVAFLGTSKQQPSAARKTEGGEEAAVQLRFVAGSATAKIQVYDTAAGRRPQSEVVFGGDTRVTALAPEQQGLRVWAANGMGSIQLLDLATNKLMDALKGAGGSVRSLVLHPGGEPLIASAGLDRFLRIHSTATKASAGRVYLKQQLTGVCWLPVRQVTTAAQIEGGPAAAEAGATEEHSVPLEQQQSRKRKKKKEKRTGRGDVGDGGAADAAAAATTSGKRRKKISQA